MTRKTIFFIGISSILLGYVLFASRAVYSAPNQPCGNGVCQQSLGENVNTCPADCGSPPAPTPTPTTVPPGQLTPTPTTGGNGTDLGSTSPTTTTASISESSYASPTLTAFAPDPTNNQTPTYTGLVSVGQGTITQVEYSIDGGTTWLQAQAQDGSFNSATETYIFTTPALPEGVNTVRVRGKNSEGVYSKPEQYAVDTITIATSPPVLRFPSIAPNPTKNQTPTITATAIPRFVAVERVEISIDGGILWQRMNRAGNTYTLTLRTLDDGNYPVRIRATDVVGNRAISETQTLIIDTIPPVIGGMQYAIGPQILVPDSTGLIHLAGGTDSIVMMSMKGGPIDVRMQAGDTTVALRQQTGTNVWYGVLRLEKPGQQELTVTATDGADNRTQRALGTVSIEQFGTVADKNTASPVGKAVITVYAYQQFSGKWVVWDGASFGQKNPYVTTSSGTYSFMMPLGKYFMEIKAPGYKSAVSEIVDVPTTTVFTFSVALRPRPSLSVTLPFVGALQITVPTFIPDSVPVALPRELTGSAPSFSLLGKSAPNILLQTQANQEVRLASLKGKKLVLTFFAPWSSLSLEQMKELSDASLEAGETEHVIGVAVQESVPASETFINRGKYRFKLFVDPNGEGATAFAVSLIPHHLFIDSAGVIRDSVVGVLKKTDILEKLGNLQ